MKHETDNVAVRWMATGYNGLNLLIAYILLVTGFALTLYSVADVWIQFREGQDVIQVTMSLVHHLLLIMIILEILWTLKNYIRTQRLSVEAFLIIAIISSVRKILVASASVTVTPHPEDLLVSPLMMDLLMEAVIIFLMVVAIFVLRKSRVLVKDLDNE